MKLGIKTAWYMYMLHVCSSILIFTLPFFSWKVLPCPCWILHVRFPARYLEFAWKQSSRRRWPGPLAASATSLEMDHPRNHWTKTTPWDWHSHVLSMFGETGANLLAMRVTSDEVSLNTCQFLTVLLSKARSGCWLVCHWSFGSSWRAVFFFGRAFLPSIMYILYIIIWFLYKPRFFCFP